MKMIILAYAALIAGVLLADVPELTKFLNANELQLLTKKEVILPVFFGLILLTIKGIYHITEYTDETIPLKLGVLALLMSIFGYFVFFRILILGVLILIAATHWNRRIVLSYYPRRGRYLP